MIILAIDPGPTRSAALVYDTSLATIRHHALWTNEELLERIRLHLGWPVERVVIEKVEGFGMAVGAEVFETVFWSGRFAEAASPLRVDRIGRKAVKAQLCGTHRAKDPNVRQALIDRFGGSTAIGRKATPGPLYGIAGDQWAALAVAVAYAERVDR